jgi:predicted GIY-YIG superfamily endonuclease
MAGVGRSRMPLRSPTIVFALKGGAGHMYSVYILKSQKYPTRIYIGLSQDPIERLKAHNRGTCDYSKKYGPWELHTYTVFSDKKKAEEFEKYLKSGSGFAFLKKRFL